MAKCAKCGANLLRQTTWACVNCKLLPGDVNADLVAACRAVKGDWRQAYNQYGIIDREHCVISPHVVDLVCAALAKHERSDP